MSRIYDALKRAQREKASRAQGGGHAERRGSVRRAIQVPLLVYGHAAGRTPFHEETQSVQVNAGGGLVALSARVTRGQRLLLVNRLTEKEQECEVVSSAPTGTPLTLVGIKFARPAKDFWQAAASKPRK